MVRKPRPTKASKTTAEALAELRGDNVLATTAEVVKVLRVHRTTVARYVEQGLLDGFLVGDRLRIKWESVEKMINGTTSMTVNA